MSMMSLSIADISARYSLSVTGILAARSSSKNWKNMGGGFRGLTNGDWRSLARLDRWDQRLGRRGNRLGRHRDNLPLRRRDFRDVYQGFGVNRVQEILKLVIVARRGEF